MKKINLVFVLVIGFALLIVVSCATPSIAVNNSTNSISNDDVTLEGVSYIIVHALNPEGIEIASIEGMYPHNVKIYDGDTLIGYGAHDEETCNQPIAISSGGHTVKAVFNGITESKNINIVAGDTQQLFFIFSRTEYEFDYNVDSTVTVDSAFRLERGDSTLTKEEENIDMVRIVAHAQAGLGDLVNPWAEGHLRCSSTVSLDKTSFSGTVQGTATITDFELSYPTTFKPWARIRPSLWAAPGGYAIPVGINIPIQSTFNAWFIQKDKTGVYPRLYIGDHSGAHSYQIVDGLEGYGVNTVYANIKYTKAWLDGVAFEVLETVNGKGSVSDSASYSGTINLKMSSIPYDMLGTGITCPEVQIPVASFTYSPTNPVVGEEITFDASSSYDPDGEIVSYNWTFGDGNSTEGEVVTYAYSKAGNYTVTVRVTDNDGLQDSTELSFWVGRPVLLVHGIYSSSKMWDTSMFSDEFIVETINLTPNNGDIPYLATQLKDEIQSMKEKYGVEEVDIVAHSMGGLVSRWYIQKLGGRDVNKLIMIGTPNHGSELGNLGWLSNIFLAWKNSTTLLGPAAFQMAPHSPFLRNLNQNDKCADRIFGPDLYKVDSTSDDYFVLATRWIPTPSHIHIKILGVDFKKGVLALGDGVVPYNSAKLDNVDIYPIFPWHCAQGDSASVINEVKDILRGGSW